MTELIGVILTLVLRWPIWAASAFAMVLFVGFGSGWQLWMYPAMTTAGTLVLAALDWAAFRASLERPSGPFAKFIVCLAIEGVLCTLICGATIVALN